jgi:hypothetical protein
MANFIRVKRTTSTVQQYGPAVGELVLNTASGYLYTTRDDNALVLINNGIPGPTGPSGVVGPSGAGVAPYYGSFYDTTTQTNPSGTSINKFRLNSTYSSNSISIVSGYLVQVENSGVYNIQHSAQLDKTDTGSDDIAIWLAQNNVNVPNSATNITVAANNGRLVAAWNWFLAMNTNDTTEIRWRSNDLNLRILASGSSANVPAIPSVILTVNRVA